MKKIVSLVGLPGSGKTTVGKALRDSFSWFYVDVDEEIEKDSRRKIVDIIREEGEVAFRALEREKISKLTSELLEIDRRSVLCPGGGALLNSESRELLLTNTFVVHIDISINEQLDRVYNQEMEQTEKILRPLLVDKNTSKETLEKNLMKLKLLELRQQRKKCFENADFKISSNSLDAFSIASKINNLATKS